MPQLIEALREQGADDVVIAGGVIPQQDYGFLEEKGVALIFGPGTPIPEALASSMPSTPTTEAISRATAARWRKPSHWSRVSAI